MAFDVVGQIGTVRVNGADYAHLSASPDGNCLFHSVGFLLERDNGPLANQNRDQMWMRQQVTAWVVDQAANHSGEETGGLVVVQLGVLNKTAVEYQNHMNADKSWGDE